MCDNVLVAHNKHKFQIDCSQEIGKYQIGFYPSFEFCNCDSLEVVQEKEITRRLFIFWIILFVSSLDFVIVILGGYSEKDKTKRLFILWIILTTSSLDFAIMILGEGVQKQKIVKQLLFCCFWDLQYDI